MPLLSEDGPAFEWDPLGFMVIMVPAAQREQRIAHDLKIDRHLVAEYRDEFDMIHLKYRLRMEEDVLDHGGLPTGEIKITWSPKRSTPVGWTDDSRWTAPPDPEPEPMVPLGA